MSSPPCIWAIFKLLKIEAIPADKISYRSPRRTTRSGFLSFKNFPICFMPVLNDSRIFCVLDSLIFIFINLQSLPKYLKTILTVFP